MDVREPIWTEENKNRRTGETDFKQCGWCRHARGGTYRYSAALKAECALIAWGIGRKVEFDTPCRIAKMGKDDLRELERRQRNEASQKRRAALKNDSLAAELVQLAAKAKPIPPQPDSRPYDYYAIGERAWMFADGKWLKGVVTSGYRHHDGPHQQRRHRFRSVVTIATDDGDRWCGYATPLILKEAEVEYFKAHKQDCKDWLQRSDREYNGDRVDIGVMFSSLMEAEL